ncbi:hypothetical protein CRI94_03125 [Longibacter salinarum]|uniref:Uncharacterized protein n=1 Tax=Longibacter salinarum TaxID=1850348 RepID=A0A2A8D2V8_9BACT|nr:hypothetical protein [Longibacter salinarum]PEN15286.1 hypothetical protein CRI94_03125 [Longibacter salinarum]
MSASTTPSGTSLPFSLSRSSGSSQSVDSWREDDVRRALRHHARALRALRGSAYETLSDATRSRLIEKLENDWAELKSRLRSMRNSTNGSEQSLDGRPGGEDRDSWVNRISSTVT